MSNLHRTVISLQIDVEPEQGEAVRSVIFQHVKGENGPILIGLQPDFYDALISAAENHLHAHGIKAEIDTR